MKVVVRFLLLAASAVLGVVAAAYIAGQTPAVAPGDTRPQARATAHVNVMPSRIQLQQPAVLELQPVGRAFAEAPLPPRAG